METVNWFEGFLDSNSAVFDVSSSGVENPWVLQHPSDDHLEGSEPDLVFGEHDECEVYVGDKPIVMNLQQESIKALERRIATLSKAGTDTKVVDDEKKRLSEINELRPYWRYYALIYGVGVTNPSRSLRELQFKVSYKKTNAQVTILDVFPRPEFFATLKGDGEVSSALSIYGELPADAAAKHEEFFESVGLPFRSKMEVGGKGEIFAKMSFSIGWPVIEAYGMASSSGGWLLRRDRANSCQQLFCHVIHVQEDVESVCPEVTVGGVYRRIFQTPTVNKKTLCLGDISLK